MNLGSSLTKRVRGRLKSYGLLARINIFFPKTSPAKKGHYAPKSLEVVFERKKVLHNLILESHFSTTTRPLQTPQAGAEGRILAGLTVLAHLELGVLEGKIPGGYVKPTAGIIPPPKSPFSSCAPTSISNFAFSAKIRQGEGKKIT